MRWQGGKRSTNVEDRRGETARAAMAGGGGLLLLRFIPHLLRSKLGRTLLIGGVIFVVGAKLLGVNVLPSLLGTGGGSTTTQPREISPQEQELADFISVILGDTETTWHNQFQKLGGTYQEPVLVMFSGAVNSACGYAQAAVGPFYCSADHKLYIDLSFYQDLKQQHHAPGDFAQAYVIAHEVGHHVQNLLGISDQVRQAQMRTSKTEANQLSVMQELQADCFAGIWGHYANVERGLLESGDYQEALVAASAIGDDRLQKQARGYVTPDSFTHGTSEQRVRWFREGFESGALDRCDTFSAPSL